MQPPPNTLHTSTTIATLFLLLILTFSSLPSQTLSTQIQTHPTDIQSLKTLKSALNPLQPIPGSCLASWNFSHDPCASASSDYFTCGIKCDASAPFARVIDLSLDPAGYSGSLSSLVSLNLTFLQTLSLSDNFISGQLPDSLFANLTRLNKLILSRNFFSGGLPQSLSALTQLQELCLDNNDFQGPIFANLVELRTLKRLELQRNRFSGKFPELDLLKDLYFLDVSDNQLAGKIEQSMLPDSLTELSLRNNSFESFEFTKLPFLQVLDLSHNALSGAVSSDFFIHTSLQQLTLSHNNLSSIEDFNLNFNFNRSNLVSLDLSHNKLQGSLPEFMARLPALSSLSLEQNTLTGQIPSNYAKRAAAGETESATTSFGRLLLGGNYLYGLIPGPLTSLKPGRVNLSLVDNCLYSCPNSFFFCQGGNQKSVIDCSRFRHFNLNKNN